MSSHLEHVAFNVGNIDWYSKLFQEIFGMNIKSQMERVQIAKFG